MPQLQSLAQQSPVKYLAREGLQVSHGLQSSHFVVTQLAGTGLQVLQIGAAQDASNAHPTAHASHRNRRIADPSSTNRGRGHDRH